MASLKDSLIVNPSTVGPVITPAPVNQNAPPSDDAKTTTRTSFPQPVPANLDIVNLWNIRSSGLPSRGRIIPVNSSSAPSSRVSGAVSNGTPGAAGAPGANGVRGSLWYEGIGAPTSIAGQLNGDQYLDTSTGDVYSLIAGVWTFQLNITGAAALLVTQTAHGFGASGSIVPVYFQESSSKWQLAKADNANTLGSALAKVITANTFYVLLTGLVTGFTGLTTGEYYFVSDSTAGALTITEPTSTSSFSNPMIQALSTATAILLELRPSAIGGTHLIPSSIINNVSTTVNPAVLGNTYRCDTTGGSFNIDLPAASTATGSVITIIKISSDLNTVTAVCAGSDTILGASSLIISFQYSAVDLQSSGSSWDII